MEKRYVSLLSFMSSLQYSKSQSAGLPSDSFGNSHCGYGDFAKAIAASKSMSSVFMG